MNNQLERQPNSQFDSPVKPLLCLTIVGALVMFLGLGKSRLWDQDEGYFAAAAAEMFSHANWIVPTYNGELFSHKPPMMYWGMMLGYSIFGVNEIGARCVAALLGLATVLITYLIGRRLFDARTAFFGSMALMTSVYFTVVARAATPDIYLTFFTTLSFLVWLRGLSIENGNITLPRTSTWVTTYAAMSLGVLTKGPIGLLFPAAVIGLFLLSIAHPKTSADPSGRKNLFMSAIKRFGPHSFFRTVWIMRPFTAIAVIGLIAGPWYVLVGWHTDGQFLREFFGVHHFGRFTQSMDNHSGSFFFYLTASLVGLYPWSGFAIPVALHCGHTWRLHTAGRMGFTFAMCWASVYFVIFSLANTKLANYVIPAYPALALLIGHYFSTWYERPDKVHRGWLTIALLLLGLVGLLITIGLPVSTSMTFDGKTLFDRLKIPEAVQSLGPKLGLMGIPLFVAGALGMILRWRGRNRSAISCFCVCAATLVIGIWQIAVPSVDGLQTAQSIAQDLRRESGSSPVDLAVLGHFRPSMVFYIREPIRFFDSVEDVVDEIRSGTVDRIVLSTSNYLDISWHLSQKPLITNRFSDYIDNENLVIFHAESVRKIEQPVQGMARHPLHQVR